MARNPLAAKVTADVSDYLSGIAAADSKTESFADTVSRATRKLDDFGDQATTAAGRLGALSAGAGGAAVAVGLLSTALAPLALTLGGVATAVGSVAAALGAFIAIPAITHTEELTASFNSVREEIMTAAETIGAEFAPIIANFIGRLGQLAQDIVAAIGPLGPFKRALDDVFDAIIELTPKLVAFGAELARDTLPILRDVASFLIGQSGPAFRDVQDSVTELLPQLRELTEALVDAAPAILETGTTVATTLIPALTDAVAVVADLARQFNRLPDRAQQAAVALAGVTAVAVPLATTLASLVSAITTLTSVLGLSGGLTTALGAVGGAISSLLPSLGILSTAAGGASSALGTLTGALVGAGGFVSGLLSSVPVIGTAGSALVALATGPVGIIIAAIGALVLAVGGLAAAFKTNFLNIRTITNDIFDQLDAIIGDFVTFLQTEAPALTRQGFRAVGAALRATAIELYNAVTGNKNSVLRNVIGDFVSYLITDAPGDLLTGLRIAFDVIRAAANGLVQGLTGNRNATLPSIITDFATFLVSSAVSILTSAGKTAFDAIRSVAQTLYEDLIGGSLFPELFRDIASFISGTGTQLLKDAFSTVVSTLTGVLTPDGEFFLVAAFEDGFNAVVSRVSDFETRLKNEFSDVAESIGSALSNISIDFPEPPQWLQETADAIGGSLSDAMQALADGNLLGAISGGDDESSDSSPTSNGASGAGTGGGASGGVTGGGGSDGSLSQAATVSALSAPGTLAESGPTTVERRQTFDITVNAGSDADGRRIGRELRRELRGRGVR